VPQAAAAPQAAHRVNGRLLCRTHRRELKNRVERVHLERVHQVAQE
jgi:hypothetical protein